MKLSKSQNTQSAIHFSQQMISGWAQWNVQMVKAPKMHIFRGVLPIVKSMQRLISPSLLYRNQHNKVNPENPWNTPNFTKIPCLHLFSFVQNIASHKLDITSLTQKHWDCKFFLLAKRRASLNKKEQHKKQGQSETKINK